MDDREYKERIYAGVLGKLVGVFYGRPIEGWPYEKIRDTFRTVDHYVYKEAGTPLIVADDDLAGTFVFLNAAEDCEDLSKLTSGDMGEAWLDYIIENKTIFWWGGLGRSTEHTAYLRLKQGFKAPESGSIKLNGAAVAEQIGAQIFMDGYAMMCPDDPEKARYYVRRLSSVSHDGIAVESACLLAAMESMAFGEKDINRLLDRGLIPGTSDRLKRLVDDVRLKCSEVHDWRQVRQWLDDAYGYGLYPGNCHVMPNLALILVSLLLGGDDFQAAMNICVSSGWDTDCNGANLGCLNGIRLGLDAIDVKFPFRGPLADRFYQISSNGGACVSDAVLQTRRIFNLNRKLYKKPEETRKPRFLFELPGSVQGFSKASPDGRRVSEAVNGNMLGVGNGIYMEAGQDSCIYSTPVMWCREDRQSNYCLTGSPTLYEGQTVRGSIRWMKGSLWIRPCVKAYDFNSEPVYHRGEMIEITEGTCSFSWKIPAFNGQTLARLGVECISEDGIAAALLEELDWFGAPEYFKISGSQRNYDVPGFSMVMESFVASAAQFSFDSKAAFVISHTEDNGVVTTGTEDWDDYCISAQLKPGIHKRCGLVARARGHRRYYGLLLKNNKEVVLVLKKGSEETVLASAPLGYENDGDICLSLSCRGGRLWAESGGKLLLETHNYEYSTGGAGFVVDTGTVLAEDFQVKRLSSGIDNKDFPGV